MKAIFTKYLGPTNFRGARVKATEPDGRFIMQAWKYDLSQEANHLSAAEALKVHLGWDGVTHMGWIRGGYVHVFDSTIAYWPLKEDK